MSDESYKFLYWDDEEETPKTNKPQTYSESLEDEEQQSYDYLLT